MHEDERAASDLATQPGHGTSGSKLAQSVPGSGVDCRGTSTVQTTPEGLNSRFTRACGIPFSMRTLPKPLSVGGFTRGPPLSFHSNLSQVAGLPGTNDQLSETLPAGADHAP